MMRGLLLVLALGAWASGVAAAPRLRALRQAAGPLECTCPQAAVFAGACYSTQAALRFSQGSKTYIACTPPPAYDPFARQLAWSACLRPSCLPSAFAGGNFTASLSAALVTGTDMLLGPATFDVQVSASAGVTLTQATFLTASGDNLQAVGASGPPQAQLGVPADGVASLTAAADVAAADSSTSTWVVSLVLSDASLAGQPPVRPLPPSPPPQPPPQEDVMYVPEATGLVSTSYSAGYDISQESVPPYLDENTTVTVNGTFLTTTAGYADFSIVGSCADATLQASTQILKEAGWQVAGVSCSLNPATTGSAASCRSSLLLLSVTVLVGVDDATAEAQRLASFLTASSADGQGLGASCTTAARASSQLLVQETVDPATVPPAASSDTDACAASRDKALQALAGALALAPNQLLYLPASCSAYTVYPPPSAPPPPPDAPVLVRQPYSIWRSAVLGGILGGVFVAQIIVLAVWIWHNRREHRRAEAHMALAYAAPYHTKYGPVDTHNV